MQHNIISQKRIATHFKDYNNYIRKLMNTLILHKNNTIFSTLIERKWLKKFLATFIRQTQKPSPLDVPRSSEFQNHRRQLKKIEIQKKTRGGHLDHFHSSLAILETPKIRTPKG